MYTNICLIYTYYTLNIHRRQLQSSTVLVWSIVVQFKPDLEGSKWLVKPKYEVQRDMHAFLFSLKQAACMFWSIFLWALSLSLQIGAVLFGPQLLIVLYVATFYLVFDLDLSLTISYSDSSDGQNISDYILRIAINILALWQCMRILHHTINTFLLYNWSRSTPNCFTFDTHFLIAISTIFQ